MSHWIHTFLVMIRATAILLAVAVMPSNASAMIDCTDTHDASQVMGGNHHGEASKSDHATGHGSDHGKVHCASHSCVVADILLSNAAAPHTLVTFARSWDATSLVNSATPEGLRRPPRV